MPDWIPEIEAFIRDHHVWAGFVVGVLCFLESLVFVSLLVPATALLIAAGALVGAGLVGWYELVIGGIVGCLLGDTVSYWLGRALGARAREVWPFRTRPQLLDKGQAFFARHGAWGVFGGRFLGPLRASVPTCAGIMGMPHGLFQFVSFTSALVFVPLMIIPGALVAAGASGAMAGQFLSTLPLLLFFATPIAIAVVWLRDYRRRHADELPDERE